MLRLSTKIIARSVFSLTFLAGEYKSFVIPEANLFITPANITILDNNFQCHVAIYH